MKRKNYLPFLYFFALIVVFIGAIKLQYVLTNGFKINKIVYRYSFVPAWESAQPTLTQNELFNILQKKFTYLGKGRQCYVFEGDDYVIKFVRYHKYQKPFTSRLLENLGFLTKGQKKVLFEQKQRHIRALDSYKIAFEKLKQKTGLEYIHLNKTKTLQKEFAFQDLMGRKFKIDLDKTAFIVQKKGRSLEKTLLELNKNADKEAIKMLIASFVESTSFRLFKGVLNRDEANSFRNAGCLDNEAFELDVGSFYLSETVLSEEEFCREFLKFCDPLKSFLQKQMAEFLPFFEIKLTHYLNLYKDRQSYLEKKTA